MGQAGPRKRSPGADQVVGRRRGCWAGQPDGYFLSSAPAALAGGVEDDEVELVEPPDRRFRSRRAARSFCTKSVARA